MKKSGNTGQGSDLRTGVTGKMTELLDNDKLTAHHEASHAVTALILGYGVNYISIDPPAHLLDNLKELGSSAEDCGGETVLSTMPAQYADAAMVITAPAALAHMQGYAAPEKIYEHDRALLQATCEHFFVAYTKESWKEAETAAADLLIQQPYAVPAILSVALELMQKRRLEGSHIIELFEASKRRKQS